MHDEIPSRSDAPDPDAAGRYAELELDADAVIVYDRRQTQAWIQSDVTIPVGVATDDDGEFRSTVVRERRLAAANAESPVSDDGRKR